MQQCWIRYLYLFVNSRDVISQVILHDESFQANVAAEWSVDEKSFQ
jgi:hypothetical protein